LRKPGERLLAEYPFHHMRTISGPAAWERLDARAVCEPAAAGSNNVGKYRGSKRWTI
jgi:hypothetical protein